MNSLLSPHEGSKDILPQQKVEENYFMEDDEEAEAGSEEVEDIKTGSSSSSSSSSTSSPSQDSRKEERKEEEEEEEEEDEGGRRRGGGKEERKPFLPSIHAGIGPFSPPCEPEGLHLPPHLRRQHHHHQQQQQQQQQQASPVYTSVNSLPEKIANHPWILCLTKNDYISPSMTDASSSSSMHMPQHHPQQQQPQHPSQHHPQQQQQQGPQSPQGILVYPPSASQTNALLSGHHHNSPASFYPSFLSGIPHSPEESGGHHQQQQHQQHHMPPQQQQQHLHHIPQHHPQQQQQQQQQRVGYQIVSTASAPRSNSTGSSNNNPNSGAIQPVPNAAADGAVSKESNFLDITEYLNMPQTQAAKHIGIPTSTLSKRWREAARQRKWPWRTVCKIDKEIMTLLHNVPTSSLSDETSIPEDVKQGISLLLRKRQSELQSVVIRIN